MNRHLTAVALGLLLGSAALSAPAVAAEAPVAIPASSADIWKAIDGHVAELHKLIHDGKLGTVHQHAFAIRDLVQGLATHSPGLSADALAKVKAQGKFVDTLAERLDQTGDANDKAATDDNMHKLEAVLKSIRAQYP